MTQTTSKFDLEERTAQFGEQIILFAKSVPQDAITKPLINQIIRSATSIGANYMEANGGSSKKDFRNKIHICKKEAQETQHWLRMLNTALPDRKDELRVLWQECHELVLIFQKIASSLKD
jgi:four helix bundle protein